MLLSRSVRFAAAASFALLAGCAAGPGRSAASADRLALDIRLPADRAAAIVAHACRDATPGIGPSSIVPLVRIDDRRFRIVYRGDERVRAAANATVTAFDPALDTDVGPVITPLRPAPAAGRTRLEVRIEADSDTTRIRAEGDGGRRSRDAIRGIGLALRLGEALHDARSQRRAGNAPDALLGAERTLALLGESPSGAAAERTADRLRAALLAVAAAAQANDDPVRARDRLARTAVVDARIAGAHATEDLLRIADAATLRAIARVCAASETGLAAAARLSATASAAGSARPARIGTRPRFELARAVATLAAGSDDPAVLERAAEAALAVGHRRTGVRLLGRYPRLAIRIPPERLQLLTTALHVGLDEDTAQRIAATERPEDADTVSALDTVIDIGFELAPGVAPLR